MWIRTKIWPHSWWNVLKWDPMYLTRRIVGAVGHCQDFHSVLRGKPQETAYWEGFMPGVFLFVFSMCSVLFEGSGYFLAIPSRGEVYSRLAFIWGQLIILSKYIQYLPAQTTVIQESFIHEKSRAFKCHTHENELFCAWVTYTKIKKHENIFRLIKEEEMTLSMGPFQSAMPHHSSCVVQALAHHWFWSWGAWQRQATPATSYAVDPAKPDSPFWLLVGSCWFYPMTCSCSIHKWTDIPHIKYTSDKICIWGQRFDKHTVLLIKQ